MTQLRTVDEVIDALGGTGTVARLLGRVDSAVSNWRRIGKFPARTLIVIQDELGKIDCAAPASLWTMEDA